MIYRRSAEQLQLPAQVTSVHPVMGSESPLLSLGVEQGIAATWDELWIVAFPCMLNENTCVRRDFAFARCWMLKATLSVAMLGREGTPWPGSGTVGLCEGRPTVWSLCQAQAPQREHKACPGAHQAVKGGSHHPPCQLQGGRQVGWASGGD